MPDTARSGSAWCTPSSTVVSAGVYAASWVARRQGKDAAGTRLALVGMGVSGAAAYLGGHLAAARKVSSHHPAYDAP